MATNNSTALAATYAIHQATKQNTLPMNPSHPLSTVSSSSSTPSLLSSSTTGLGSSLGSTMMTAHTTGLPSMTGLPTAYPSTGYPSLSSSTVTTVPGVNLPSSSSTTTGMLPPTIPSATPTTATTLHPSTLPSATPSTAPLPPTSVPTIPPNLIHQAQQISNRHSTTPLLPNIPSSIPLQLMDRVTGKARIRNMAKYFDPSIELEEGAVELVDELMGKLVEDWTFMAANIARIRTIPSTDSGLVPMTTTGIPLASSVTNAGNTTVTVPIGTGVTGGHPILEPMDYHSYISQVYPYLTLPTENITTSIAPKAPPAYASMESLVAKQRLAVLNAALTNEVSMNTSSTVATTIGETIDGSSTSSTNNGKVTSTGSGGTGGKTTDGTNPVVTENEGSKTGKSTVGGSTDTTKPSMMVRSAALTLKKRGRPPKNPALIKLNGGGGGSGTVPASSSSSSTSSSSHDTTTGASTGSDKPETKKVSLVLGKSPSFAVAGSSSSGSTSSSSTTTTVPSSTSGTGTSGSTTAPSSTSGTGTVPRLLLRIGGPKPPSSSSSSS